jgi:SAM-dependent methyltransferase
MTNENRQHSYWETPHGFRSYLHPVVAQFAQQRIAFLRQSISFSEIKNALDVGCGNGFSTFYMNELVETWGVDLSWVMLSDHPFRHSGRVARGKIPSLPYASESFDLVYSWEVLHHLQDPQQAVQEMIRISKKYVIIVEPNRNNPVQLAFSLLNKEHRWVQRYSLKYMKELMSDHAHILNAAPGGWVFPNVTPIWLAKLLFNLPYEFSLGISNWVIGIKK